MRAGKEFHQVWMKILKIIFDISKDISKNPHNQKHK